MRRFLGLILLLAAAALSLAALAVLAVGVLYATARFGILGLLLTIICAVIVAFLFTGIVITPLTAAGWYFLKRPDEPF